MRRERVGNILPGDGVLRDRTQFWSDLFKKYECSSENSSQHPSVRIGDYLQSTDLENDDNEDNETIDPVLFEDNVNNDDPDFDVNRVANETKKIIKKRKERWHKNGFDLFMDSFFTDGIHKVDDWLKNNCDYFSSKFDRNSNRFEINERNFIMEKNYDDHSVDSSVDTAAYIKSNRKRRTSKVTMTIKQFCYSTQNTTPLQPKTKSTLCRPKMLHFDIKQRTKSDTRSSTPPLKHYSKRRKPASVRRAETSSTSSSSASSRHSFLKQRTRKYRKRLQMKKKLSRRIVSDDDSESSRYQQGRNTVLKSQNIKESPHKFKSIVKSSSEDEAKTEKSGVVLDSNAQLHVIPEKMPRLNKHCAVRVKRLNSDPYVTNGVSPVFNSTAIKSQDSMTRCKRSFESICNNVIDECSTKSSSNSNKSNNKTRDSSCKSAKSNNGPKRIPLYTPGDPCTPKRLLKNGRFTIDEKYLEEKIGTELKNRFLATTKKKFPLNCSAKSELVFIAPDSTDTSSDSEADDLDRLGRFSNGQILEYVRPSQVKDDW